MSNNRFKHHRIVELNGFQGLNSHDEILGFYAKDFIKSLHNFKDKIINITKTKISWVRSKNSPCSFTRTILERSIIHLHVCKEQYIEGYLSDTSG